MASCTIPSWLFEVTCPLCFKSMLIEVSNQHSDLLVIPRCFWGWLGWCRYNNSCILHAECSYCKYSCVNATMTMVHWSYCQLSMASEIQSQTCLALLANSVVTILYQIAANSLHLNRLLLSLTRSLQTFLLVAKFYGVHASSHPQTSLGYVI